MKRLPILPVLVLVLVLGSAGAVRADDAPAAGTITRNPSALSDADLDARIDFIEQRLEASRKHAFYWQWGWTGIYGSGLVIESLRAGLTKDDDHRVDYIVSAVKAAGGVARLTLQPHPVRNGADPLRAMDDTTHEAKARKLARAEDLLAQSAKFTHRRWTKRSHVLNVLVNVAAGGIVWGLGDSTDAAVSTGVGIAVGTANVLSAPWHGEKDLEDYKVRFGGATARGWDWKLVPTAGGAAIQVNF